SPGIATSLYAREPGFALFYAYLNRRSPKAMWRRYAERYLERAMDAMPIQRTLYFAAGSTGTAWAVEHLDGLLVEVPEDLNDDVDAALIDLLHRGSALGYDLHSGVAGFGLYATE